jgi:hypothetical protein
MVLVNSGAHYEPGKAIRCAIKLNSVERSRDVEDAMISEKTQRAHTLRIQF